MNRLLLVTTLFTFAGCATSNPTPEPAEIPQAVEGAQASESGAEEFQARNNPAAEFEGIEDIEVPSAREIPTEMMPHVQAAEPEVVCERMVPSGSVLAVEVCRTRADIERRRAADQKLFEDIKRNTAIFTSRL